MSYSLPSTKYQRWYSEEFESGLANKKKESNDFFERLVNKIDKIVENPEHYAPSKSRCHMAGIFHAFVGQFAIVYFEVEGDFVEFHHIKQRS